ncbi:hypothetical protein DH2020_045260 [Rehmannia glutinosa]|uniref:Uncharacterized protein n=1 Tax=Rehmannia glutinosa TaxID=99300 RepID=A0ABR0UFL2_REHGL
MYIRTGLSHAFKLNRLGIIKSINEQSKPSKSLNQEIPEKHGEIIRKKNCFTYNVGVDLLCRFAVEIGVFTKMGFFTKEFEEIDAKASLSKRDNGGFIKLGRKDIHPRVEEIMTKNEPHDEEAEDDENTEEEVQENKHEEVENLDAEVDREEDILDDEREDGVENETEEKDSDEAREVLYKADDASSAVTHDTRIETIQNVNERVNNSNERPGNTLEQETKETYSVEGGELAKSENPSNESTLDDLLNGSPPNSTLIEVSNSNIDTRNSTTEVTTRNPNLSLQNVTRSESGLNQGSEFPTIALEQAKNSTLDSNSIGDAKSKSNFEEFSNSSALVKIAKSEGSVEVGNETNSATEKNEKLDLIDGTDEVLESPVTENLEETQADNVDLSDSEKNVRMDLDTLPEIQTEGTNSEDIEAE